MDEDTVLKTAGCKSLGGSIPPPTAVFVAQSVLECLIVSQEVAGSNPVRHP